MPDPKPTPTTAVVLPPEAEDTALVPLRYRFDGWTAPKQRAFLAALADTGCIRDACRAVGLSKTSAYRLRDRSAEFAAEWDRALSMAATVLEQVAFQRAVLGVEEEIWHYGKLVGTRRRYSDSLLRLLVLRGDLRSGLGKSPAELVEAARVAARNAGGMFSTRDSDDEVDRKLRKQLDVLAMTLRKDQRAEATASATALLEDGSVP